MNGSISDALGIFSGAVTAAKTVRDAIRKLSGDVDMEMRNALNIQIGDLIEAMQKIRERYTALCDRVTELEAENRNLRQFEIERENYILEELAPNAFAYTVKADAAMQDCKPYLCAHCFDRKVKSILQLEQHAPRADILKCPACATAVHKAVPYRGASVTIPPVKRRSIFDD